MIPAAFEYVRAHTADEAFASLQQHGAEARVLAGGQSLIPAMRFRLARPAVLVDINPLNDLSYLRIDGKVLAIGAIARDVDIERAPWIADRRWSLIHDASRVVADPVVRQMGTVVGSLCHNDPAGDWTAVALAARAWSSFAARPEPRRVNIDEFLVDSYTTAAGEGEMALGVEFPVPDDRLPARIRRSSARSATSQRPRRPCKSRWTSTARSAKRASRSRPRGRAPCAWTRPSGCLPDRSRAWS